MRRRVWMGLLLIVLGMGLFLQQSEILDFSELFSTWWPLILIVIGIVQLAKRTYSSPMMGFIFLAAGILFFINERIDFNAAVFIWPLILILIGIGFLFSKREWKGSEHTGRLIKVLSLFSGADVKSRSSDFNGGIVTSVFGGAEVDLLEADFPNEAEMNLTTVFGGIEVRVPRHVHVEISGLPLFGGWDNSTRVQNSEGDTAVLKINCLAVFGGVEIKN